MQNIKYNLILERELLSWKAMFIQLFIIFLTAIMMREILLVNAAIKKGFMVFLMKGKK